MRRYAALGALGVGLVWAALGAGGPVARVPVQRQIPLAPYGRRALTLTFKGGETARVIVSGNGQTYLGLYVYDEHGNCVAWSDLRNDGTKDDLAVQWQPPRTAPYTIEVRNFGALPNAFTRAID